MLRLRFLPAFCSAIAACQFLHIIDLTSFTDMMITTSETSVCRETLIKIVIYKIIIVFYCFKGPLTTFCSTNKSACITRCRIPSSRVVGKERQWHCHGKMKCSSDTPSAHNAIFSSHAITLRSRRYEHCSEIRFRGCTLFSQYNFVHTQTYVQRTWCAYWETQRNSGG